MMKKALPVLVSFILVLGISLGASAGESLFVLDKPIPESINSSWYMLKGRIPPEMDIRIDGEDYVNPKHYFEKLITFEELNQTKKLSIDVVHKSGEVIEQDFVTVERSNQMRIDMWIGTKYIDINYKPVWPVSTPIMNIDDVPMVSVQNIQKIFDGHFELCLRTDLLKFIYDSKVIKINFDSNIATIDKEPVEMPSSPKIMNGTTFLPLQFMFELFGCDVSVDHEENKITAIKTVEPFVTLTKKEYFENIWIYEDIKPHKTLENTYVLEGNKTWEARKKAVNPDVEPIPREDLTIKVDNEEVSEYKPVTRRIQLGEPSETTFVTIEVLNKLGEIVDTVKLELNR